MSDRRGVPSRGSRRGDGAPFVGRVDERVSLVTRAERRAATLLRGRAGVGKTRLAAEVAAQLGRRGDWLVVRRQATSTLQQVPLGVFSDLLDDDSDVPPSGAAALGAAYRAIAKALVPDRSVLVIDDAPLLDEMSAVVVQRLVENDHVAIVLTARSGQTLSDGLTALLRSGHIGTVELGVLSAEESRALAVAASGNHLAASQLDDVAHRAAGVPLHVLALVAHLVAEPDASARPSAPAGDFVALVLGERSEVELDALGYVALAEPLELQVLDRLVAAETLERLEAAGLITVAEGAGGQDAPALAAGARPDRRRVVGMVHPLYGEAVMAALGELRRRRLRRALAAEIERFGARRDDVLRAVRWRLDAHEPVSPDRLLHAAGTAIGRGDVRLGEHLLRASDEVVTSAEGACLLAGICIEQARPEEAVALCRAARPTSDDATRAKLAMHWAIAEFGFLGDAAAARAVLDRFRAELPPGPWRSELDAFDITIAFYSGDLAAAERAADIVLNDPAVTGRSSVWLAVPIVLLLATLGRAEQAWRLGTDIVGRAHQFTAEIVAIDANACCVWGYASLFHGDVRGCRDALSRLKETAAQGGDLGSAGLLQISLGAVALQECRFEEAAQLTDLGGLVFGGWHLFALGWRAHALALAGRAAEATALLPSLAEVPHFAFHGPYNEFVRGEVARARGDLTAALACLERAAGRAQVEGQHAFGLLARLRALGVAPDDAAADALADVARRVDGPLADALGSAAGGWLARDVDAVEAAAHTLDDLGSRLYGLHLTDLAAALAETTERGSTRARRLRDRAAARWAEARGVAVPSSTDPAARPGPPLTARERAILELVLEGRRDSEIATMLDISPRTVHAHLRTCYRKLGVAGRAELLGTRTHDERA